MYHFLYKRNRLIPIFIASSNENEVVPKVIEAILHLPKNIHVAVRHTAVLLLGELSAWVEKHPASLDPILNFLVNCLPQADIGAAAATSLQNISVTCNEHMPRHVPILLQIMGQIDTFAVTNNAVIGLLSGVAHIIGKMFLVEYVFFVLVALHYLIMLQWYFEWLHLLNV